MAANKVRFLTGANSDVNSVAKVAGQILFAVDSNNYGYIYYDKDNSTRVNMSITNNIAWASVSGKPQLVQGGTGTTATDKFTIQLYDVNGAAIPANTTSIMQNGIIVIPAATNSLAGLVSTAAQTWAGVKTFSSGITVSASSGFNYSGIAAGTANVDRVVWFSDSDYIGKPVYDNDLKYNPSTNTLKLTNLTATGALTGNSLTVSSGDDSLHSTEAATLKVTGGVSVSMNLSAKSVRIDNGMTTAAEGFKLIYNSTDKCLEFQYGN